LKQTNDDINLLKIVCKSLQIHFILLERGYFRSPGRGVKNGKIEFPFLSFGRTPMRRCAFESCMSQLCQAIFSIQ